MAEEPHKQNNDQAQEEPEYVSYPFSTQFQDSKPVEDQLIDFRAECRAFADYIRHHDITKEKVDHVVDLEDILGHSLVDLIHKYHTHKYSRILIVTISTLLFSPVIAALALELTQPKIHAKDLRGPLKTKIVERYVHYAVGDTLYFTSGHNQPIFIMHDTHFAHAVKIKERH